MTSTMVHEPSTVTAATSDQQYNGIFFLYGLLWIFVIVLQKCHF
uniref:Uncharacterized protein n=1 Tax=Nelumbo nucifera TaxID=4432 RepID=A0A822XQZ7_NELNU|nr:TPA_asm: hypothetical protein HUJ06_022992 [Nelumbo nucifera]